MRLLAKAQRATALLVGGDASVPPGDGSLVKRWRTRYSTSRDKATRANPYRTQMQSGNVPLVRGDWNREYLSEIADFPGWHPRRPGLRKLGAPSMLWRWKNVQRGGEVGHGAESK